MVHHKHRDSIQAKLTAAELAFLRLHPVDTWAPGGGAERDLAVLAARNAVAPGQLPTVAAGRLAAELVRYAGSAWRFDRDLETLPADASAKMHAMHRLLRLNNGDSLGKRRIFDICRLVERSDAAPDHGNCTRAGL